MALSRAPPDVCDPASAGPSPQYAPVFVGADDVIKAEQAVALQFYDKLSRRLAKSS